VDSFLTPELESKVEEFYRRDYDNPILNYTLSRTTIESKNTPDEIAFLFMTNGESINEDLWSNWFPPTSDTRYRILVHTKPSESTVPLGPFFCPFAIPSVETA
jgi:hypothetical protein